MRLRSERQHPEYPDERDDRRELEEHDGDSAKEAGELVHAGAELEKSHRFALNVDSPHR